MYLFILLIFQLYLAVEETSCLGEKMYLLNFINYYTFRTHLASLSYESIWSIDCLKHPAVSVPQAIVIVKIKGNLL